MVNAASKLINLEETNPVPWSGRPIERPRWPPARRRSAAAARLGADDYVGDVSDRTGFGGLEAVKKSPCCASRT